MQEIIIPDLEAVVNFRQDLLQHPVLSASHVELMITTPVFKAFTCALLMPGRTIRYDEIIRSMGTTTPELKAAIF